MVEIDRFKILKSRLGSAAFCALAGLLLSSIIAGLLSLITNGIFLSMLLGIYIAFGAPTAVVALLHLLFPSIEKIEYGLGAGGYYGGLAIYWLLGLVGLPKSSITVFVAYIISVLICTIIAINHRKSAKRS